MFASLQQVEPLTVDVLQMRIPNCRTGAPCRTGPPKRRGRGNRSRSGRRLQSYSEGRAAWVRGKIRIILQGCDDRNGNPCVVPVRVEPPVLGIALASLRGQTRSTKCGPLGGWVSSQDRQDAMVASVNSANIYIGASSYGRSLNPTGTCCILWPFAVTTGQTTRDKPRTGRRGQRHRRRSGASRRRRGGGHRRHRGNRSVAYQDQLVPAVIWDTHEVVRIVAVMPPWIHHVSCAFGVVLFPVGIHIRQSNRPLRWRSVA
mmetsp:Transcript_15196/g.43183  ORF Transcript_15196/g.43183 Transcript_15196/m.43183 type:complete len:259 (-) Transcript_15196:590-1366(-)